MGNEKCKALPFSPAFSGCDIFGVFSTVAKPNFWTLGLRVTMRVSYSRFLRQADPNLRVFSPFRNKHTKRAAQQGG